MTGTYPTAGGWRPCRWPCRRTRARSRDRGAGSPRSPRAAPSARWSRSWRLSRIRSMPSGRSFLASQVRDGSLACEMRHRVETVSAGIPTGRGAVPDPLTRRPSDETAAGCRFSASRPAAWKAAASTNQAGRRSRTRYRAACWCPRARPSARRPRSPRGSWPPMAGRTVPLHASSSGSSSASSGVVAAVPARHVSSAAR